MGMVAPRRRIGSAFFVAWGQYGQVSEFARQQGISRQWVYREAKQVTDALAGTQTRAERRLIADGKSELVLRTRKAFQGIMRAELVAGVESLTGRTVIAVLSSNSIDPDIKVKSFLLVTPCAFRSTPLGD